MYESGEGMTINRYGFVCVSKMKENIRPPLLFCKSISILWRLSALVVPIFPEIDHKSFDAQLKMNEK